MSVEIGADGVSAQEAVAVDQGRADLASESSSLVDVLRADAEEVAAGLAPLPTDRFADRELAWLAFNMRVLELAEDESAPLLERAKFLAIFASNLDEFYMVRVAGLKRRIAAGIAVPGASGLLPRDQIELIWKDSHDAAATPCRRVPRPRDAGAAGGRDPAVPVGRAQRRRARRDARDVPRGRVPGAHAVGRRPRAPVPVHLRAVHEPRGGRAQPDHRRRSTSRG